MIKYLFKGFFLSQYQFHCRILNKNKWTLDNHFNGEIDRLLFLLLFVTNFTKRNFQDELHLPLPFFLPTHICHAALSCSHPLFKCDIRGPVPLSWSTPTILSWLLIPGLDSQLMMTCTSSTHWPLIIPLLQPPRICYVDISGGCEDKAHHSHLGENSGEGGAQGKTFEEKKR